MLVVEQQAFKLDSVLHIDLDGFAYADAYENQRYVGLAIKSPSEVRPGGLIVDPKVARQQIANDTAAAEAADNAVHGDPTAPSGKGEATSPGQPGGDAATPDGPATVQLITRFNATKELTSARVVRDVSHIYEEIISHFVSSGVEVRVTLDIESGHMDKLSAEQRTAIRENLSTLGFREGDWSMS